MENITILLIIAIVIVILSVLITKIIDYIKCKPFKNEKSLLESKIYELDRERIAIQNKYDRLNLDCIDLQKKCDELHEKENEYINKNIQIDKDIKLLSEKSLSLKNEYEELYEKKKYILSFEREEKEILKSIEYQKDILQSIEDKISTLRAEEFDADKKLHEIQSKIDLYSRIDDFVEYGIYENPCYIYETSERFSLEIKKLREQQKRLIEEENVLIDTSTKEFMVQTPIMKRILTDQKKMMIRSFNIECDMLIEKVNPSNIRKILERIDSVATGIEKLSADLHYGFNIEYIKLKYEECKLQYQFKLKKKDEQEEQRAIKEQIREEQKARREYERARQRAEKEEEMYQRLLDKAKAALEQATEEERQAAQLRIDSLEAELQEAKAKAERAVSMAQQTKKGHVYIISNIGSFGEGIYKIGLTRRLDPTERVHELGGPSVPFRFDIHAMISSDNAPELESRLHKAFNDQRVNTVNLRKEFFKVSLEDIKCKVEELTGKDSNFVMTILAEEYYQSQRMRHH